MWCLCLFLALSSQYRASGSFGRTILFAPAKKRSLQHVDYFLSLMRSFFWFPCLIYLWIFSLASCREVICELLACGLRLVSSLWLCHHNIHAWIRCLNLMSYFGLICIAISDIRAINVINTSSHLIRRSYLHLSLQYGQFHQHLHENPRLKPGNSAGIQIWG